MFIWRCGQNSKGKCRSPARRDYSDTQTFFVLVFKVFDFEFFRACNGIFRPSVVFVIDAINEEFCHVPVAVKRLSPRLLRRREFMRYFFFVVDSLDKHIQNEKKFILALVLILADAKKTGPVEYKGTFLRF